MAVIALVLSIISILGLIVLSTWIVMSIPALAKWLAETKNPTENSTPNAGFTPDFAKGYEEAKEVILSYVQLALFDMGQNLEILNFEEEVDTLMHRMDKIVEDTSFREDLLTRFREYMEEQNDNIDNF